MSLIRCRECGREVSTTADYCPNCGAKVTKPKITSSVMDTICIICLIIATFAVFFGMDGMLLGYAITLFWLIVYQIKYDKHKDDDFVDCSALKKTRDTIAIFFVLQFGIVIIF